MWEFTWAKSQPTIISGNISSSNWNKLKDLLYANEWTHLNIYWQVLMFPNYYKEFKIYLKEKITISFETNQLMSTINHSS